MKVDFPAREVSQSGLCHIERRGLTEVNPKFYAAGIPHGIPTSSRGVGTLRSRFVRNIATLPVELALVFAAVASADKVTQDPDALLRQIRGRTAAHLAQLPNYTCHQVVDRMLRHGSTWNRVDTVEFEVAFVGRQELFSRPGEEKFGERSIGEMAPGTISDGVLGSQST